ncbi:MAG TPA: ABC-F family ATP-binding cassette domain-containing protein [Ilumatobacter sp.]|nr:ABC-F family ATP-binding cassette domain-containing protein [Ilumatobacter sp.]
MSASLSIRQVTVTRGANTVLADVELSVAPGQRVGLVGPNGVGKSTLLAVAARQLTPDRGTVVCAPPTALVGWLHQEPERSDETVHAALRRRTGVAAADLELEAASADLASGDPAAADRYDTALTSWLALGSADLDSRVGEVANELGIDVRLLHQPTLSLSGGEAARVGLAALLLSRFDVYLLDEPTNDLDLDGLDRLERWVLAQDAPMLIVSHDRRFLDRVITGVAEIDQFAHTVALFGGGWSTYLEERERAQRHAWERFEEFDSQRKSLSERAQRQREWSQQGLSKVRRSDEPDKNIKAFKLNQTEQLAGKAAQTKRAIDRLDQVDKPREPWELRLEIPDVGRSGDVVCRVSGAVVRHGDFQLGPIDLLVEFGERIALVGHNGSGKSTLLDVMLGRREPDEGVAQLGPGVVVGEIEQVRAQLVGTATLLRAFMDATGWAIAEARTLLAKFGLVGDHVERPTESLSPGERTRAALALMMANGANLLVLDEPTNHLDLPAIEQLEQAIDTFPGTLIVVSHDRELLSRMRTTRTVQLAAGSVTAPG